MHKCISGFKTTFQDRQYYYIELLNHAGNEHLTDANVLHDDPRRVVLFFADEGIQ